MGVSKYMALAFSTMLTALAVNSTAEAQFSSNSIKILVLNDASGPFRDNNGPGSVEAARMAAEEFKGSVAGLTVEIVAADHQNKADVGANLAREWIDTRGVAAIADVPVSSVALAINGIVRDRNKVLLLSSAGAGDFTGKACSPNTVQWTFDSWSLAHGTAAAIARREPGAWFFISADYAFGRQMTDDASKVVKAAGREIAGVVHHQMLTSDFSSFLLQAQNSGAKVVALANAGADTSNSLKQAGEFGLVKSGLLIAAMLLYETDVRAVGLDDAQGTLLTTPFYWDRTPQSREWSKRFFDRTGAYPTMNQAGVYAGVLHYLKAVEMAKTDDGRKVVAKMKDLPTDDPLFGQGRIRADGRKLHPMYLYQVKSPAESQGPWDLYKLIATIPAEDAFKPMVPECDFK